MSELDPLTKCPKCGAKRTSSLSGTALFECGSYSDPLRQTDRCKQAATIRSLVAENAAFRASWGFGPDFKIISGEPRSVLIDTPTGDRRRYSMADPEKFDEMKEGLERLRVTALTQEEREYLIALIRKRPVSVSRDFSEEAADEALVAKLANGSGEETEL